MMPSGFWFVRIMAYPFGSGGKITVGNGALKMKTPPPGRAPPERAPEFVLRLRLCLPVGRGYMDTQGSTYYYLAKLAGPLTGGSPTRQREESRG
jgi:hypothetical protein